MTERFIRNEMLLGPRAMEKLKSSHVCVVGLGGDRKSTRLNSSHIH